MKYKYGNRKFWAKGYYCVTVGHNEEAVKNYIRNQLQEDKLSDQMSMKEFIDPLYGNLSGVFVMSAALLIFAGATAINRRISDIKV